VRVTYFFRWGDCSETVNGWFDVKAFITNFGKLIVVILFVSHCISMHNWSLFHILIVEIIYSIRMGNWHYSITMHWDRSSWPSTLFWHQKSHGPLRLRQ
jgi:hypothetical protein